MITYQQNGKQAVYFHYVKFSSCQIEQNFQLWGCVSLTGWLGKAVFFTPVAFTVLIDIFFYLRTGHTISQMSTYGRIHHKMKYR